MNSPAPIRSTMPTSPISYRWSARSLCSLTIAAALAACGDDASFDSASGTGGAGGDGAIVTELFPDAPPLGGETECKVVIAENLPLEGSSHRELCSDLDYGTSPPSSGDHWPVWARLGEHPARVRHELLVHNLEHGFVLALYRDASIEAAVDALRSVRVGFGPDPLCENDENRVLLAPDPSLKTPIGLAAWRATYTATCIDPPSLEAFVRDHYALGPENLCAQGRDPLTDAELLACL